ncbi:MAG: hypothetical protein KC933_26905 [Myxococcales bacterium]|nr:hypothetical protein [Myxococcales bacterium]
MGWTAQRWVFLLPGLALACATGPAPRAVPGPPLVHDTLPGGGPDDAPVDQLTESARYDFAPDGTKTLRYTVRYRVRSRGDLGPFAAMRAEWSPWFQERPQLEATVTEADVQARYTVTYDAYSSDGVDFIDGQVVYTSRVITSGADVSVSHEEKGLVTISGSQDAVLDLDVAFRVDVAGSTGSVTVVVDGTVTADGETFSYSDESLSLTAATF